MNQETEKNISFIDAQNLHLGTQSEGWQVNFERFRVYLKEKYGVTMRQKDVRKKIEYKKKRCS